MIAAPLIPPVIPPHQPPPLSDTNEIEKLVFKIYVRLLLYAKISYSNKKKIGTFSNYLNRLASNNKSMNDGDRQLICGARSIDDMFLDSITKKHLSSEETNINIQNCPDDSDIDNVSDGFDDSNIDNLSDVSDVSDVSDGSYDPLSSSHMGRHYSSGYVDSTNRRGVVINKDPTKK